MNTFILALSLAVLSVCLIDAVPLGGQQQSQDHGQAQIQGNIKKFESGLDVMFKDVNGKNIKGLGAPAGVAKACGGGGRRSTTAAPATTRAPTTAPAGK